MAMEAGLPKIRVDLFSALVTKVEFSFLRMFLRLRKRFQSRESQTYLARLTGVVVG